MPIGHGNSGQKGGGSVSSAVIADANGALYTIASISELVTIAAAATSVSASNLIPANALIMGVSCRVTVVIPTAVTFIVAVTAGAVTLMSGVAVAANTTDNMFSNQSLAPFFNGAATTITITPNLTPGTATGRLRIVTFYAQLTNPTS